MARTMASGRRGQLRAVAILLGVCCAAAPLARSFAAPILIQREQALQSRGALTGVASRSMAGIAPAERGGVTATEAMAVSVSAKVLSAVSAGAVAAVVEAMLSCVTEPIVNRVLVKRMSIKDAMADVTPAMSASFFTTTISTNLIKFPLFEAVAMFISLLPDMSTAIKGIVVGFVFTTATLPITNFRYRMSIQTPVAEAMKPGLLYQAYAPTVVRDMVYAIARGALTSALLLRFSGISASSPQVLFAVVLGSCIISAPFNEIRGFLLQSQGKKLTFREFFKPINFVRSTSLGAINQAIALATGYYFTPIVGGWVKAIHGALDTGDWKAFVLAVAFLDVVLFFVSKSVSKGGVMSDRLMKQLDRMEAEASARQAELQSSKEEIARLKESAATSGAGSDLKSEIVELRAEIKTLGDKLKDGAMA